MTTTHHGSTKDCPTPNANGSCPGHERATNIMDIEVNKTKDGKVRIKFVAFVGETGPELLMPEKMAHDLLENLRATLGVE